MSQLFVTDREGSETALEGKDGVTVMEIIRAADVADPFALCGGACSCATCHVYVDEAFSAELPPMGSDEDDVLEGSSCREANSRLSCQIAYATDLDGLRVTIAPAD